MVRFAVLIHYNDFNLGNKFSWNITNDENKLDFIMVIEVGDDEDLSKSSGNKDGVEQINSCKQKMVDGLHLICVWEGCHHLNICVLPKFNPNPSVLVFGHRAIGRQFCSEDIKNVVPHVGASAIMRGACSLSLSLSLCLSPSHGDTVRVVICKPGKERALWKMNVYCLS